ncbi:Lipase 2 [Leucoagaricus sp. SymC.cos]|nr:Lipase 2 [Leucoagaricus sp. SymC.cos]
MRLLSPFVILLVLFVGAHAALQVKIGKTMIIGRDIPTLQQEFFGGIPFTEPPLGKLRLRPSVLKTHLDINSFGTLNYGPGCLQLQAAFPISEDCLMINILCPSRLPQNAELPVLFWVYGSGFQEGVSSIFNGSAIVAQSIAWGTPLIYVNFNYCLRPLGFPQDQEAANQKALNLALKDEIAALEWVQQNIGTFGGDKSTAFTFPSTDSKAQISDILITNFSPPAVSEFHLESTIDKILQLYPDIPALGSPFNTGNNTFGLLTQFKHAAAILGDTAFHFQCWFSSKQLLKQVSSHGDTFSLNHNLHCIPSSVVVTHGSEVVYVYGAPQDQLLLSLKLSTMMIDYWVSFAMGLNPNDGKGLECIYLCRILYT